MGCGASAKPAEPAAGAPAAEAAPVAEAAPAEQTPAQQALKWDRSPPHNIWRPHFNKHIFWKGGFSVVGILMRV